MISMTRVTAMSALLPVTGVLGVAGVVLVPDILGGLAMASVIRLCLMGWGVARVILAVAGGVVVHVRLSGVPRSCGGVEGVAAAS